MTFTIDVSMSTDASHIDRARLSSAQAGDKAARDAVARDVGRLAYVFALQLTHSSDAAEDVAQDAVLSFFRRLDRFDTDRPVEPWLYQIVRNRVRDLARRDRLRQHDSLDAWLEIAGREVRDDAPDPASEVEQTELRSEVWRGISSLRDDHMEILVLRDFHDLSYRQIAEVLTIPHGTVMSRLHAARRGLREALTAEPDGFFSDRGGNKDD
jgi:RNA polymerase sigma-70 factor (ECF subfamily)